MNYRHVFHAGNFADCLKHAALVAVLLHLRKKDTPFAVIDTHGGRGLYDIGGVEAKKTGEAKSGIDRLLRLDPVPGVLEPYIDVVRGFSPDVYPGSPLIAAKSIPKIMRNWRRRWPAIRSCAQCGATIATSCRACWRPRSGAGWC
jgi:23S rRNA (adenine2030-N6)-methyltransferase